VRSGGRGGVAAASVAVKAVITDVWPAGLWDCMNEPSGQVRSRVSRVMPAHGRSCAALTESRPDIMERDLMLVNLPVGGLTRGLPTPAPDITSVSCGSARSDEEAADA